MTKLAFIWAENKGHYIGKDGSLPWYLPNDLKFFKENTKGHPVIMGRKTYESLPFKPLPKRINIVLTTDKDFQPEGVVVVHNLDELHAYLEVLDQDLAFAIGGSTIFDQLIEEADFLYQTKVDNEIVGDVKMAPINWENFELINDFAGVEDEKNVYPHHFYIYEKRDA